MKDYSRQPRKQRLANYNKNHHAQVRSMSAHLSDELLKEYGLVRSVTVRKGDTVKVVRGIFKGHASKVAKAFPQKGFISIEETTLTKADGKKVARMFRPSNVILTKLDLSDPWRREKLSRFRTPGGSGAAEDAEVRKKEAAERKLEAAGKKVEAAGKKVEAAGEKEEAAGTKEEAAGKKVEAAGEKEEAAGKKEEAAGKKEKAAEKNVDAAEKKTAAEEKNGLKEAADAKVLAEGEAHNNAEAQDEGGKGAGGKKQTGSPAHHTKTVTKDNKEASK